MKIKFSSPMEWNTMIETGKLLTEKITTKTIVLTGAMIPYKFGRSDRLFNLGSAYTNKSVANTNYLGMKQDEKQLALFSAIQYKSEVFAINTVLRKEWQSAFEVPYIPALGFSAQLSKHLQFRLKYNRNFRSPSFNDRFAIICGIKN